MPQKPGNSARPNRLPHCGCPRPFVSNEYYRQLLASQLATEMIFDDQ
jgi:hypothetical protein